MTTDLEIAIVGAGLGGLAAAVALRKFGYTPTVYEQAPRFSRVGAGINVSPNCTKALMGLGLHQELLRVAHQPQVWVNRDASGELISKIPLGREAHERYGAEFLQMHRADLHAALVRAVPEKSIKLGHRLESYTPRGDGVIMDFDNGQSAEAHIVIGADGIHSRARDVMLGDQPLHFTGRVAFRGVISADRFNGFAVSPMTKWWGLDRHIVIYHINPRGDVYYVTSVPDTEWKVESWSAEGDVTELRSWFQDFHPEVRGVLDRCKKTHKWALYDREPLPGWHQDRVVLLGDACHPMTPYLAQGAAMAIEDAVVLARLFDEADVTHHGAVMSAFEKLRWGRTSRVQRESGANRFGLTETDPDWIYSYDAWQVDLRDAWESGKGDVAAGRS